jgi:hypothetical protein
MLDVQPSHTQPFAGCASRDLIDTAASGTKHAAARSLLSQALHTTRDDQQSKPNKMPSAFNADRLN